MNIHRIIRNIISFFITTYLTISCLTINAQDYLIFQEDTTSGKYGLLNKEGKVMHDCEYSTYIYNDELYMFFLAGNSPYKEGWKLYKPNGELVHSNINNMRILHNYRFFFANECIKQYQGGLFGLFNLKGENITGYKYHGIHSSKYTNHIVAYKDEKCKNLVLLDTNGVEVFSTYSSKEMDRYLYSIYPDADFDITAEDSEVPIPVIEVLLFRDSITKKCGIIDNLNKKVNVRAIYDDITTIYPTDLKVFIVRKGNKYGMINHKGKILIPIEFDSINNSYQILITKKNGLYGLRDLSTGKNILKPKYPYLKILYTK